jgi:hypothetical protein
MVWQWAMRATCSSQTHTKGESFKVDGTSGLVTRVAGTGEQGFGGDGESARNASFRFANSMSVDKAGNLLIADYGNCRIRTLEQSTGIVRILAVTGEVNQNGSCAAGNLEPYLIRPMR